jgi:hypothetical protein
MKLIEFHVRNPAPGPPGHRDAITRGGIRDAIFTGEPMARVADGIFSLVAFAWGPEAAWNQFATARQGPGDDPGTKGRAAFGEAAKRGNEGKTFGFYWDDNSRGIRTQRFINPANATDAQYLRDADYSLPDTRSVNVGGGNRNSVSAAGARDAQNAFLDMSSRLSQNMAELSNVSAGPAQRVLTGVPQAIDPQDDYLVLAALVGRDWATLIRNETPEARMLREQEELINGGSFS